MATFYADTGSFEILSVTNLTALTSSILYFTSSTLDIGTNIISVNVATPQRFGGLAVIDSGSGTPYRSGSILFDSQNNQWIFIHQNTPAGAVTSSVFIQGPQTFNNLGNETTITTNRLTKGAGGDLGEHITSSNVTDTGTLVSINSITQITGSTTISGSGVVLQLIGSGSTIFSISGSAGEIFKIADDASTTSLFTVSSGSTNVLDIDSSKNVRISGSLIVTGSIIGTLQGTASTASYYQLSSDILAFTASGAGTYTPTAGMKSCYVVVTGGGGAGGQCNNTDTVTGGGGSGGTAIRTYTAAQIGTSQPYFVGAGGSGTTSPGGSGTASSFGGTGTATAISGSGGGGSTQLAGATTWAIGAGGAGGAGTGGELNISGSTGFSGYRADGTNGWGGAGAASYWGGGAQYGGAVDTAGVTATIYGAGGSGAHAAGTTDRNGGNGANGVVYIIEYF